MEQGWIYVLVNSSMPGLAKVGRTTKPPHQRAAELSGATGVATPFVLAFDQAFADCCAAEKTIHAELERRGLRLAANREFFRGPVSELVRVILDAASAEDRSGCFIPQAECTSAQSLLAAGDRHLFGTGDALQDTGEAVRCYKLAAARGSLVAFDRLGRVFGELYAAKADRAGRRRALRPLKEGARRGNYYCYAEMAGLFAGEKHMDNFRKSWDLFFARREAALLQEVEADPDRYAVACCRFVAACLALGEAPGHRDAMLPEAQRMKSLLLEELDRVRTDDAARLRVAGVLRWLFRELLSEPASRTPHAPWRLTRPQLPAWLPQLAGARAGVRA